MKRIIPFCLILISSILTMNAQILEWKPTINSLWTSSNIGLGIDNPDSKLHIYSNTGDAIQKIQAKSGSSILQSICPQNMQAGLQFWENSSIKWNIFKSPDANADLVFYSSDLERLRILQSNGYIGIGTNTPNQMLEVSGNIRLNTSTSKIEWYGNTLQLGSYVDNIPVVQILGSNTWSPRLEILNAGNTKQIITLNTSGVSYFNGGNVGIGTLNPDGLFQVGNSFSNIGSPTVRISTASCGSAETVVDALHIDTQNSGNFYQGVAITLGLETSSYGAYTSRIVHYGNVANTVGSKMQFQTHSNNVGIWNTGILIDNYGKVGINTTTPGIYDLNVCGSIRANEIVVNTTCADFVFAPTYKLRPLSEVESFIKENQHLPEVAPAAEMKSNGMGLSEMQTKLLQKVEELTIYAIEQDKKIAEQERKNSELQQEIKELKELVLKKLK